ncbi:D-tyrosyl-tRNA(Tyr) deacylase [bacterium]|jgi:D-tyrosyl-tRNA(Tyr) deacylase|nr:D-tyrosyl-tRNA(Tyr) deacylase [bacterium]MBT7310389.1 D-tyrosyl-tRNA(Tyr) deacylase [bacterium]
MRCVIQRVSRAKVTVDNSIVGSIEDGLVVLVAFAAEDSVAELSWMANKIPSLRLFNDSDGKINLSLRDINGSILLVSQFTLYGDCRKGNRPSFVGSAKPEQAIKLYSEFAEMLREKWSKVEEGIFGASMQIDLINDGPVTVILDRDSK